MAKFCGKCGTKMEDDDRFCPSCGFHVPAEERTVNAEPPAVYTPPSVSKNVQPSPNVQVQTPKKSGSGKTVGIIIGVIAAVVVLAAAAALFFVLDPFDSENGGNQNDSQNEIEEDREFEQEDHESEQESSEDASEQEEIDMTWKLFNASEAEELLAKTPIADDCYMHFGILRESWTNTLIFNKGNGKNVIYEVIEKAREGISDDGTESLEWEQTGEFRFSGESKYTAMGVYVPRNALSEDVIEEELRKLFGISLEEFKNTDYYDSGRDCYFEEWVGVMGFGEFRPERAVVMGDKYAVVFQRYWEEDTDTYELNSTNKGCITVFHRSSEEESYHYVSNMALTELDSVLAAVFDQSYDIETPQEQTESYPAVTTADTGLRMRFGPGTEHDIIITLPYGTPVIVKGVSGDWLLAEFGGISGWMSSEHIQKVN